MALAKGMEVLGDYEQYLEDDLLQEEEIAKPLSPKKQKLIRKDLKRATTIPMRRAKKWRQRFGHLPRVDFDYIRPKTREQCLHMERPCPFVSCIYHLYLDVNPKTGSIKLNFPETEVWEMEESCVLDVAERGGITLEEVGEVMNLTRERVRQLEFCALNNVKHYIENTKFAELIDEEE